MAWLDQRQLCTSTECRGKCGSLSPSMLEVTNLSVRFGQRDILSAVSCSAAPGEVVALVGPNGAGKTTLLRALAGLHSANTMTGTVNGGDRIALCPDSSLAFVDLSPAENIELLTLAMELGPEERRTRRQILLDLVSIDEAASVPVDSLSLGQRRRLDISLTLCKDASVYLFDEPFNGLDALWLHLFTDAVRQLSRAGKITIIASHAIDLLLPSASVLWEIVDGWMIREEHGPTASLCTSGLDNADAYSIESVALPWLDHA